MTEPLRVLLADDQTLVRTGFRLILGADGIDVVTEATNGAEAVEAVRRTRPDVVLMDVRMPEMDGLEATRRILAPPRAHDPVRAAETPFPDSPRVIILTTFDLDRYVNAALSAGASGFLLKDVTPEQLTAAVRTVRTGDALLAPAITRRLVERFAAGEHRHGTRHDSETAALHRDLASLTPRELEVFGLLARGLSNAELANRLHLAETTVKTHVARILAKLGLRDRVQAVIVAYETGLVSAGEREATEQTAERSTWQSTGQSISRAQTEADRSRAAMPRPARPRGRPQNQSSSRGGSQSSKTTSPVSVPSATTGRTRAPTDTRCGAAPTTRQRNTKPSGSRTRDSLRAASV